MPEPLPVELMNTVRADADLLDDAWLRAVGLPAPDDLDQLRTLRRALRRLAADATDDPREPVDAMTRPDALAALNSLAGSARPELSWPGDGPPARTLRGPAAGVIATLGVELLAGADRGRLRACLAPNCVLYFVKEHTRREWCSPNCGNRARVARHYQRHRQD
ncbi:CGNR zinc finger domain-containing protein [Kutzneria kofuensis]|uniref:Putative RNA-binding Zn ribbon-like protein n=1 Tax=Kutzneria kofuensis TaxID=103725 RepID=A0A7W9NGD6_9PSEU|nr:CGNR zinc finger domain-containing protein [Kutzneria kofuensis]MBB5891051.1 putative RNA-binding Zn ribbon-like protein [Kutzneria kofuensis]